ncbi:MAG: citramalate synthase [Candidatus Omnitrophota bacterium]
MNVKLYDTTLRDGTQMEGVSLSVNDKLRIAQKLDELGVHYIEGGWPLSNPKDVEFFTKAAKMKFKNAKIVAFGSTCRAHIKARDDKNIKAILKSKAKICTIFGKTWDIHVKEVLRITLDENLKLIENTISYLRKKGLEVFYDAEHFFDGYRANPSYAIKTLESAKSAGASCVILCDTNGGTVTSRLQDIIRQVKSRVDIPLGIHVHNDCELAVANSIAAVEAGCVQVQGTINGYGERCGNANLISIIPVLQLKMGLNCVSNAKLRELTEISHFVAEVINMKPREHQPFVGSSAFAHKGGVHIDAVIKNPKTYEHIEPEIVGNKRRVLISELAGRTGVSVKSQEMAMGFTKDTAQARRILKLLQEQEHKGFYYEAAEGSFELLMKRAMRKFKKFFELEGFKVIIEKKGNAQPISEASIKIKVRGVSEHTSAEGDGPVNALDNALRKALEGFYPSLKEMHLSDFKVRIIDEKAGTAAKVRILIQCHDKKDSWWTLGVSENIIDAAWQALVDSVEYKLLKDLDKKVK